MENEKIISRVKKMLALANDAAAAEGERDNALRMAYRLIAKYNLSVADVEANSKEQRTQEDGHFHGAPWTISVTVSVAKLFFCKYYYSKNGEGRRNYKHSFVGKESNAVTARYMAEFVVTSILNEGGRAMRKNKETSAWWRSFCIGAAERVQLRISDLLAAEKVANQEENSSGTSLVLADVYRTEMLANMEWLSTQGTRLRSVSNRGRVAADLDGRTAGATFGNSIRLSTQIGTTSSKPTLLLN